LRPRLDAEPVAGTLGGLVWDWIVVVLLYSVGLLFFQLCGGLSAAAGAIQKWGNTYAERRRPEIERRLEAWSLPESASTGRLRRTPG
jgi:hypothetical protein